MNDINIANNEITSDNADLFAAALSNQGFKSVSEFIDASNRIPAQTDPAAVADHFDDSASAPLNP